VSASTPHYVWRASSTTADVEVHIHVSCTGAEISRITVTVDGREWNTYTKPYWMYVVWWVKWQDFDKYVYIPLKPGYHFIEVSATDTAGDYDWDYVSVYVEAPPPPHINIYAPRYVSVNDGDHWSGTITIYATAQAKISRIEYYINYVYQGYWSPGWWSSDTNENWRVHVDLYPGWNKISADVTDKLGRTSYADVWVYVGTVKPTLHVDLPSSGVISNDGKWHGKLHLSASDSAGLSYVSVYVDGRLVTKYTKPPWAWRWDSCVKDCSLDLGVGDHTVKVVAVGGGTSTTCYRDIYIYRPPPPKITLSAPPSERVNSPDKTWKGEISATANDLYGVNSVKIYVDGNLVTTASGYGLFGLGTPKKTVTARADVSLGVGMHIIRVVADGYGHVVSETSAKITVLPAPPPAVSISSLPKRIVLKNGQKQLTQSISARASSSIGLDYLTLSINGKVIATARGSILNKYPTSLQISKDVSLGPGNYTITATASNAGVTATATATISVVPAVAPTVNIIGLAKVMTTKLPASYQFTVIIDGHGFTCNYKVYVDNKLVDSGTSTTLHKSYTYSLPGGQHIITVEASNNYGYSTKRDFTVLIQPASVTISAPDTMDVPYLTHYVKIPITIQCSVSNTSITAMCKDTVKHLSGSGTFTVEVPVCLPERAGAEAVKHLHVTVETPFGTFDKEITVILKRVDAFKVGTQITFTADINNGGSRLTDVHCNYAGESHQATSLSTSGNTTHATFTIPAAKTGAVTICACNANGCDIKSFILPVAMPAPHISLPSGVTSTVPSGTTSTAKKTYGKIYVEITNKNTINGKKFVSATHLPITYKVYTTGETYIHEIDIYVNNDHRAVIPVYGNEKAYSGTYTLPLSSLPTYSTCRVRVVAISTNGHVAKDSVSFEVIPGKISVIITNTKVQPAEVNGKLVGWHVTLWYRITAEDTTLTSASVWLNGQYLLEDIPLSGMSVVNSTTVMVFSNFVNNTKFTLSIIASGKDGSTATDSRTVTISSPATPVTTPTEHTVTVYAYNLGIGPTYKLYFKYNGNWYYFGSYQSLTDLMTIGPIKQVNLPSSPVRKSIAGTYTFTRFGEGTFHISRTFISQNMIKWNNKLIVDYQEASGYSITITGVKTQPAQ